MEEEKVFRPGTWYFFGLGILYVILYLLIRAFLPEGVHFREAEREFIRHFLVLIPQGWGAARWGRGWAWAGVAYLAGELIYSLIVIGAGSGIGIDPTFLFFKGFLLFLGYRATRGIQG